MEFQNVNQDSNEIAGGPAVWGQLEATVIRADGTTEELGVISYYHKNPWIQARQELILFDEVKPETKERLKESAKKNAPKILGVGAVLGAGAYYMLRK